SLVTRKTMSYRKTSAATHVLRSSMRRQEFHLTTTLSKLYLGTTTNGGIPTNWSTSLNWQVKFNRIAKTNIDKKGSTHHRSLFHITVILSLSVTSKSRPPANRLPRRTLLTVRAQFLSPHGESLPLPDYLPAQWY